MRLDTTPGTVQLLDGDRPVGRATWAITDPDEGLIQVLSITITPADQRRGHGRQLLQAMYAAARAELGTQPLRRAWIGVGNKVHVVARAFLTGEGYHHVGSNSGIYRDQDLLIYVKSFD
jgi:ribosomal protein S18 acetylase RimI-like enzyme